MTDTISFEIEADPVPASRPKVSKFGTYYPKKHTAYKEYLKNFLKDVRGWTFAGAVALHFLFVMPQYKTVDRPTRREDVDNLAKLPMDSMTDSKDIDGMQKFWVDDSLVVHLNITKRFVRDGEQPHTKVRIEQVDGSIEDYTDGVFNGKEN